jgi:hypothetical protein
MPRVFGLHVGLFAGALGLHSVISGGSDFYIYIAGSFCIVLRRGDGVDRWCVLYRDIRADEESEN